MDDRNRSFFRRNIPIFTGSGIVRRASALDVRLTASDKIHNLIIQNATEEYIKLRGIKVEKKEYKPLDMLAPTVPVQRIHDLIPKVVPKPDKLPRLGIAAFDLELETPVETRENSKELLSIMYSGPSSSTSPQVEEVPADIVDKKPAVKVQEIEQKPEATLPVVKKDKPVTVQQVEQKPEATLPIVKKHKSVKVSQKRVGKQHRKRKVGPKPVQKHVQAKVTVKGEPKAVSISTAPKGDLIELKPIQERGVSRDRLSATEWVVRPASLIQLYEADTVSIPSWLNTIWVEDIEKRLNKSQGSVYAPTDDSPGDIQQRLQDIKKHLQSRNEEEYRPYAKRKTYQGISNWGAVALILKALLGSGVLRTPMIFEYIGHYTAVIPTVLLLLWISVTFHLYIKARQSLCKVLRKPFLSFSDTMKESFIIGPKIFRCLGRVSQVFFDFMIIFHQIAVTMKYGMFICAYAISMFNSPTSGVAAPFFAVPVMWVVVVIHYIKSLNNFVCIAVIANITSCAYYGVILFQLSGKYKASDQYVWITDDYKHYFYFVGHMYGVTDCIVTSLIVEAKMRHPRQIVGWSGILSICLMFAALFYIMIGFFGGNQFGTTVTIDYLKRLDIPENVHNVFFVFYTFALTVSCCIQSFYPLHILWGKCMKTSIRRDRHQEAWQYFLRTSYALLPFVAIHLPKFIVYLIMFFGYISGPFLMLFCPVFTHFCVFWPRDNMRSCMLMIMLDFFLMLLALFAMAASAMWYINKFEFKLVWGSH